IMALENDEVISNSDKLFSEETEFNQDTLNISEIVDLTQHYSEDERKILDANNDNSVQAGSMIYSPEDLVDQFLAEQTNYD
ncbi:1159_t:CDS:1, partial [Cetraspora pellucida]